MNLQAHVRCVLAVLLVAAHLTQQAPQGHFRDPCSEPDTLKLIRREEGAGMVLVCRGGQWKRVCDDEWTKQDAIVACRQLNFSHPETAENLGSSWGQIFANDANDSVPICDGHEARLSDCPARPRNNDLCSQLCARVNCSGVQPTTSIVATSNQPPPHSEIHASPVDQPTTSSSPPHTLPTVTPPSPQPPDISASPPKKDSDPSVNGTPLNKESIPNQDVDTSSSESDPSYLVAMVIGGVVVILALAVLIASATLIICGFKRGRYRMPKRGPLNQRGLDVHPCGAYCVMQRIQLEKNPAYSDLPPDPDYETVS